MRPDSLLSEAEQVAVIDSFEAGVGRDATARLLGLPRSSVKRLHGRWLARGLMALERPVRAKYSFEMKVALVERLLAGETSTDLAAEVGLSSPTLLQTWARKYRRDGPEALRPKPVGRRKTTSGPTRQRTELELLRMENERLRAEVAYLGKLRALRGPRGPR